jgi:hypothetical protein
MKHVLLARTHKKERKTLAYLDFDGKGTVGVSLSGHLQMFMDFFAYIYCNNNYFRVNFDLIFIFNVILPISPYK